MKISTNLSNSMPNFNSKMCKEVVSKYLLPTNLVEELKGNIIDILSQGKSPSNHPLAIVVGGQQGSGKTALINYTNNILSNNNLVTIDNDFFRSFHPNASEIISKYPQFYTQATDQLGMEITSDILSFFMANHYNLIIHQTLKNNRIADDAMTKLKDSGYTVGVRALAVHRFESEMSMIERCQGQLQSLDFCRFIGKEGHDIAYSGLPGTIEYIQQTGKSDFIEIFKRSEDISRPTLVYSHFNLDTKPQTIETLSSCQNVSHEDFANGFESAREAVEVTRHEEGLKVAKELPNRLFNAEINPHTNEQIVSLIAELKTEVSANNLSNDTQQVQDT